MDGNRDLELVLRSRTPIVVIESRDEARILDMLQSIAVHSASETYTPLFRWTITDGLQRIDIALEPQAINSEPTDVLKHIRAVLKPGIYVLLDFHPFLEDPVHIRLLKDICIKHRDIGRQIVLISHEIQLPGELSPRNESIFRNTFRKASWVTSSASPAFLVMPSARRYTRSRYRLTISSNAS